MRTALTGVSKRFRVGPEVVTAVDEVSLNVSEGELACVYGASGSGKTTLLSILAGIDREDSGEVVAAGHTLSGLSERGRADIRLHHIAVVFQANNLLSEFGAVENVMLPLLVRGTPRPAALQLAGEALESLGLAALAERRPATLSGGQRQRVGIARALAGRQQLLLADEPTGALDSENSRQLFTMMRKLCDESGTAVVLATHDPLAQGYADSVYSMTDGVVTPASATHA